METVQCDWCGAYVEKYPSNINETGNNFCGRSCFGKYLSESRKGEGNPGWEDHIEVSCTYCGKTMEKPPHRVNDNNFCDSNCMRSWRSKVVVTCDWCGDEVERFPSEIKRHDAHFCDVQCLAKWKSKEWDHKIEVSCDWCGESLKRVRSNAEGRNFCSQNCQAEWQSDTRAGENHPLWREKEQVACDWCGDEFDKYPYRVASRNFCNYKCLGKWKSENQSGRDHPSWKGGWSEYYGRDWKQQRRKARKRDNYACRSCGITEEELGRQLDVHHIMPFREFGLARYVEANQLLNLISYCTACHSKKEPADVLPDEVPMPIASKQVITPPIAKRAVAQ